MYLIVLTLVLQIKNLVTMPNFVTIMLCQISWILRYVQEMVKYRILYLVGIIIYFIREWNNLYISHVQVSNGNLLINI
jgi:hypothetical protein